MKKSRAAIILSAVSVACLVLTAVVILLMKEYLSDAEVVRAFVERHYVVGALLLTTLCMVQVIVALVPGELVEIAAGYAFGPIVGTLICLVGMTLGSVIVILLARRFGRKFVYVFYPKEKLDALSLFRHPTRRNVLTFFLFLIPGTPKDLLTYCIGLTDMSIPLYLLLTTVARIPSIITSTMGGDAVLSQNYWYALIIFGITAVISGLGLLAYHIIKKRHGVCDRTDPLESVSSDE